MCDFSLQHVMSREAHVGDRLVSTNFIGTITRGFAAQSDINVAVCLLPGTEIAFDQDVCRYDDITHLPMRSIGQKVARFRQVDMANLIAHHDALEFPGGEIVLLTSLCEGQRATVLQLPVNARAANDRREAGAAADVRDERWEDLADLRIITLID